MDRLTVSIKPVPPFNFELTTGYHTYFQNRYGTDSMEDGVYRRLIDLDDKLVLASVRSIGTLEAPELALELQGPELSPDDVESATDRVSWLLGVDQGLAPFYELGRDDKAMAGLVEQFYGLHLPHLSLIHISEHTRSYAIS